MLLRQVSGFFSACASLRVARDGLFGPCHSGSEDFYRTREGLSDDIQLVVLLVLVDQDYLSPVGRYDGYARQ